MLLRRARRDGDQLDPEPPPLLARGRRRRRRRPVRQRSAARDERADLPIRSVAVLGAGTMGAQIAAHFANAGVPALLLDVTADAARDGLKRARALKPDPFFTPDAAALDHDRRLRHRPRADLADVDWIVEAVVEQIDVKRALLERVDAVAAPGTDRHARTRRAFRSPRSPRAAATTSGGTGSARISSTRRAICACSRSSRPPTPIRRSSSACRWFADHRLGKGVVVAKDTPNFIANHIGLYGVVQVLRALESGRVHDRGDRRDHRPGARPAEERHVPHDGHRRHRRARARRQEPEAASCRRSSHALVERGWVGEKAGQGFYKREHAGAGQEAPS